MILRVTLSRIVNLNLIILLLVCWFLPTSGNSQNLKSINLEEIPQRKVRRYIALREIDQMSDFALIHASWKKNIDVSDFKVNEKIFYLNYELSSVWNSYRNADPNHNWNRHSIRLGLLISKYTNAVVYTDNSTFPEVDTGQVYFLNLRLMKGLINVPVAFEIINIDQKQQLFEFSYIDNNKSQGKQTIQFFDNGDGTTKIIHRSYFKSKSWFREDLLYPYFHKKFIKEFHRNMKQLVKTNQLAFSLSK